MIWLKILIGVVVWIALVVFIAIQFRQIKTVKKLGKLEFVEWYEIDKDNILANIERRKGKKTWDIEVELEYEYQMYLLH